MGSALRRCICCCCHHSWSLDAFCNRVRVPWNRGSVSPWARFATALSRCCCRSSSLGPQDLLLRLLHVAFTSDPRKCVLGAPHSLNRPLSPRSSRNVVSVFCSSSYPGIPCSSDCLVYFTYYWNDSCGYDVIRVARDVGGSTSWIVRVSLRAVSFLFSVAPFLHCDILLCAGGVGVTPMISLLQWLARAASSHNHTDGSFCPKNIVFLWTARDLETVSNPWFGEVFQSNELRDLRRICDVSFVFHNTSLPSSALNGKKEKEEQEEQSATTSSSSNSLMTTSSTTPTASSPSSSSSSSTFPLSLGPGPVTTAWAPAPGRPDLNRFFSSIDELVTCPSNVFVAVCGPTKFADEVTALAATRSFLLHRETFAL